MEFSIIVSTLAGIGYCIAYLDYNQRVRSGTTVPNGATWAIWSVIAVISAGTYFTVTGDFWKSILPILNILLCIGTFLLAFIAGKFKKLDVTDWLALGLGLVAALVWVVYKSAGYANLIVQVAIMVGFIPTWRAVWKRPLCEHPRPWWIWAASYSIAIAALILRWKNQWIDLVFPVNGVVLHASVPILAYARRKTRPII